MEILNINNTHTAANYPYGSMRTTAYFSVEFKKNKGFRSVFQTINPKTNRINKPKYGTYSLLAYNYLNKENGHIEMGSLRSYGFEEVNEVCKFLTENLNTLQPTADMITCICGVLIASIRGNCVYSANGKELITLLTPQIKTLMQGFKIGEPVFADVVLPLDEIEKIKQPAPVTLTEY